MSGVMKVECKACDGRGWKYGTTPDPLHALRCEQCQGTGFVTVAQPDFVASYNAVAKAAYNNSKAHGFWDQEAKGNEIGRLLTGLDLMPDQRAALNAITPTILAAFWRNDAEQIALIHSELSEALEAVRKHPNSPSDHIPDFTLWEEEFADVIIRIMDNGVGRGLRVAEALLAKMAFNAGRPYKHGKQF